VADVERWPSPERMLELATLYRETGEADKALAFEVWANDALAAGARIDQPIDPAIAPAPTVARVARMLIDRIAEPAPRPNCCPLRCPHWPSRRLSDRISCQKRH